MSRKAANEKFNWKDATASASAGVTPYLRRFDEVPMAITWWMFL